MVLRLRQYHLGLTYDALQSAEYSEAIKEPVVLRIVTRLAHSRAGVETGDLLDENKMNASTDQWVLLPSKPYWHDKQHGWAFKNGDAVKIKVAGKAVITVDRCCYGGKTTLTLTNGSKKIGTATAPAGNDGEPATFEYSGGEATLTLKIETGNETYIHGISVKHNGSAEFEPFKINFRRNPYSFVAPTSHAPANVKVISGKWHDEGEGGEK